METHLPHRISVRTDGTTNHSHCLQYEEKETSRVHKSHQQPGCSGKAPSEKQEAKLGVNRSHGVTQSDRRWVWAPKPAVTNHTTVRINRCTGHNWFHSAVLVPPPRKQLRRQKNKWGDASFTVKLLNLIGSLYLQSLNMLAKQIFPLGESNCTHYTTLSLELIFWQSNAHQ